MYNNNRLSLQKNFKFCIDMAQSNVNMGAPVKTCVYNVGLWRKFCIFALTKLY